MADSLNYTIKIPDTIDSTTVTATLSEASASFTINGTAGTSGIPSNAISLSEGSTTISIVVTAKIGLITNTYKVTFTKATVYVSPDGDDMNAGTKAAPMQTISAAISKVQTLYTTGEVHVAEGTYDTTQIISMKNGISLYGGYSASNWALRDSSLYVSNIDYSGTGDAVYFGSGITNSTFLDGFTVNSTGNRAVYISGGHPTITNNQINLNNSAGSESIYIVNAGNTASISNNTIKSSAAKTIHMSFSSIEISNNIISNSFSSGSGYVLYLISSGCSPAITGNTITGNNGTASSLGIYFSSSASNTTPASISGNTISAGTGMGTVAIYVDGTTGGFKLDLANNTLNGGSASGAGSLSYGVYLSNSAQNVDLTLSANTINGGTAQGTNSFANGIYLSTISSTNTATIENNLINGGEGDSSSVAVLTRIGSVQILRNQIFGQGKSGVTSLTKGIVEGSLMSFIANNVINGGNGAESHGIDVEDNWLGAETHKVFNNTILSDNYGNNDGFSIGIFINYPYDGAISNIENNIVYVPTGSWDWCIAEFNGTSDATTIKNNNFYGCQTVIFDELSTPITDISSLEALAPTNYSGNISMDPLFLDPDGADNNFSTFLDNDYRLTVSSPADIREGGLNLSTFSPFDKNEASRTAVINGSPSNAGAAGWSLGAFEQD